MNGHLVSSEMNQSNSRADEYANPRSVCSDLRDDAYTSAHVPRLPPMHALRPTGPPDPNLWYHLEWTGFGAGNGVVNSSQFGTERSANNRNSRRPEYNRVCCGHSIRCTCCKDPDSVALRNPTTDSSRSTAGKWRGRLTRRSPSMVVSDSAGACDTVVHRPLLNKHFQKQSLITVDILGTMHPSFLDRINKNKRRRKKSSDKQISRAPTATSLDRSMETLPKEVFFNRLVMTRLSIMKYMDKLFESIFSSVIQSQSLPSAIKYLFDFLDSRAMRLGVHDPKIVHAWKSNCLQMRFWNQLITNLDYIFDIPLVRNTAFERSFYAFSQAMTYACAPIREKVTSESSCVKVLFAPDIRNQWARVQDYYREIKAMPEVKSEDMHELLQQHSMSHTNEFNVSWAIFELYTKYVKPCHDTLVSQLQDEALKLAYSFKMDQTLLGTDKSFPHESLAHNSIEECEFSEWNPMQIIHTLNEVKRCMEHTQRCTWLTHDNHNFMNNDSGTVPRSPRFHPRIATVTATRSTAHHGFGNMNFPLSSCTTMRQLPHSKLMMNNIGSQSGTTTAPHSSMLTTANTTDYPDTLRSLNTLTTEFAADETSRITQLQPYHHHHHHHCYHVYEAHRSPADEPEFVRSSDAPGCSSTLPSSTPIINARPIPEPDQLTEAIFDPTCPTRPLHFHPNEK